MSTIRRAVALRASIDSDLLEERLTPQVGDLIEEYAEPLSDHAERAYQDELDAITAPLSRGHGA